MAKFSQKQGGKESYDEPHTGSMAGVDIKNSGYNGGNRLKASDVNMSVGNISRDDYPAPETSGIKIRGTGAATKGVMARGPMA